MPDAKSFSPGGGDAPSQPGRRDEVVPRRVHQPVQPAPSTLWPPVQRARYKALVVDGSGNGYLRTVGDYVHLNPVRAMLLTEEQPLSDYAWSSYPAYLQAPPKRPGWLRVDRLLGEWGIQRGDAAGRRAFAAALEERRRREEPGEWQTVRGGWFLGGAALKERLLEQMGRGVGEHHGGEAMRETAEQKAERIISGKSCVGAVGARRSSSKGGRRRRRRCRSRCGCGGRPCRRWIGLPNGCRWAAGTRWRTAEIGRRIGNRQN